MPNEPLALPELLAGLPETADYDAVLAAIMATEGGRKFLTEFADRNRNADTAMVVGAIARIEAALRGEAGPPASTGPGDLIEIAAALERIAAALAAGTSRASGTAAAIERMQDIAFMLHERPLEPTLRDAFDAAVRELSAAGRSDTDPGAGELLQALASRVREMIEARMSHRPAAALFAVPVDDGEALARAVAALAESLPAIAATPPDATPPAPPQPVEAPIVETAAAVTAMPATEAAAVPVAAPEPQAAEANIVAVEDAAPSPQAALEVFDSQAILMEAFADDHFASAAIAPEPPASDVQPGGAVAETEAPREEPPSPEPPSEAALPAQEFTAEPVAGPEEDPADLFEPQPEPPEPAAEAMPPAAAQIPRPPEPPQIVPPPPVRAIPRPPLSDPLAAVRDLSEEELIALFS